MSEKSTERVLPQPRNAFKVFRSISTRWEDNDIYGHVNNAVYYSYVDTAVNAHLIAQGVLDIHAGRKPLQFFCPLGLSAND